MADDVVALLDVLKSPRRCRRLEPAAFWASTWRSATRTGRQIFAFAPYRDLGRQGRVEKNPPLPPYRPRRPRIEAHSTTPKEYGAFRRSDQQDVGRQPNWTDAQLKAIKAPVWCGRRPRRGDQARPHRIYRRDDTGAGPVILPNASHFAFLQDPAMFNYAILHFLGE